MITIKAQKKILNLSNIQLSYWEWNPGGKPLLLLHGLADSGIVWASLGESLSDRYHIIAPDIRGHGDSSKPDKGYRCQDIINDLEALMHHVGWNNAHILTHSWVAKVAAVWATNQPDRFRSLIFVDPFFIDKMPSAIKITFPILYRVLPFLKLMGQFTTYSAAENLARQLKQYRGWSEYQQLAFQAAIEQKLDGNWGSKFVIPARNEIFQDVMDVAGLTQTLEMPILFLQPEKGLNRIELQLKSYRNYCQNLEIVKIPGNHWAFLVEPAAFNQAVVEFLDKQK